MTAVVTTAPRLFMILRLLAGRGVFRIGTQVMALAVVAVWDADTFSRYAGALGLCGWLLLVTNAPERAALKVLPRSRLLTPALARITVRLSGTPVLALLAVLVPAAMLAPASTATRYLAAGTWSACTGLLMTVCGLHRLHGRPALDTVAFGASGCLVLAATATTWLVGWAPQAHLMLLVAGTALVTGCALAALPRAWVWRPRSGSRRGLFRLVAHPTWLLGVSEVCDALCFSVVYLVLALSGQATQSGRLWLAILPATAVAQVLIYLLRLTQPATSTRLRGAGGDAGRARALELLRHAERLGIGFAVVAGSLAIVSAVRGSSFGRDGNSLVLGVLVCVVLSLFLPVLYAGYLLENTDSDALAVTSSAALAGLLAVVLLAVAVVPVLGAVGGMVTLALGIPVKAHVMRRLLLHTRPELHAAARPS